MGAWSDCRCRRKHCRPCELRRLRKQDVRAALAGGWTVPYSMEVLMEDGWGPGTIKRVWRAERRPVEESLSPVTLESESGETLTVYVEEAVPMRPPWA